MVAAFDRSRFDPQSLKGGAVHLWYALLDLDADVGAELARLLSKDEHERSASFAFDCHRRRYGAGRGLLRLILSFYSGCAPNDLRFSYGPSGKPMLDGPSSRLQFNLSHSEDRLLVGVTEIGPIGADLEFRRPLRNLDGTIEYTFSPAERAAIRALDPQQRLDAFYRVWTCKEAFIKNSGLGFSLPLQSFDVSVAADEQARILRVSPGLGSASDWALWHLRPNPLCDAAVCVTGHAVELMELTMDAEAIINSRGSSI